MITVARLREILEQFPEHLVVHVYVTGDGLCMNCAQVVSGWCALEDVTLDNLNALGNIVALHYNEDT